MPVTAEYILRSNCNVSTFSRYRQHTRLLLLLLLGSGFIWVTRVPNGQVQAPAPSTSSGGGASGRAPSATAPDFTLPAVAGESITLSTLKGEVVLINIWATWCAPCRAEMPEIQATYARYQAKGFTTLAVNLGEEPEVITAFLQQRGLRFPVLLDRDGKVSEAYGAYVLPESFLLDRQGVIRAAYRGPIPRGVLTETVEQLLGEEP